MNIRLGNIFLHPVTLLVFRLVLGITFIYASFYKIADPGEFARSIYNYRILPVFLVNFLAITMPWFEMVCGVMLIIGLFTRANTWLLLIMLLVFTVAIASVIVRGIDMECGCFKNGSGPSEKSLSIKGETEPNNRAFSEKVGWSLFTRDIILMVLCVPILFSVPSRIEVDYYLFRA